MRRAGFLIDQIVDMHNLYSAFYNASRQKCNNADVIEYRAKLNDNLQELQKQLLMNEVQVGRYHYFTIYEPKTRLICAASFPERVLHHALMNICHPYFENQLISDSYATRIGKGTYKALEKAAYFGKRYQYYIKFDIRKYFDSISHVVLLQKLGTVFKDESLLQIFRLIIESYASTPNHGLPIGNLTSQYFANFYLSDFDRFIKQTLLIKAYVRYMDDFIIWSNNVSYLSSIIEQVEQYLNQELELQLKIKYANTMQHGLNFLSYRIFHNRIELQQKSKKRFVQKHQLYAEKLDTLEFSQADYQRHCMPLISFTEHASAKGFRKKVFNL